MHQQPQLVVAMVEFAAQALLLHVEPERFGEAAGCGLKAFAEAFGPGPMIGIHPQGAEQEGVIAQGQPTARFHRAVIAATAFAQRQ